jgi:PAS domain S-box-containing protein
VIEADAETAKTCETALEDEHEVYVASDARTGLFLLTAEGWDVLLLDPKVQEPGKGPLARYAAGLPQRPEIIVMVQPAEMEQTVSTLRAGSFSFLSKPITPGELRKLVGNAAQLRSLQHEKKQLDQRNRKQRAELQALVAERTEQMEQIFANAPGMFYRVVVHPDGVRLFSFVSASCQELLGLPHTELTEDAERFDSLVHADDMARFQQSRELAERSETHFRFEGRFVLPNGKVRWMQCIAKPTTLDAQCVAYDGILLDVTERMELQSQLLLTDRLASVGTMAASVAHEVNNPLFYISSNLEALGESLLAKGGDPESKRLVQDALDGVSRIENAMRDLRTFVRSPEQEMRPVNVTKVLDAGVRLASNEIRHRATLVRNYDADVAVRADESSLAQVFLNLLVAAAQSMPEGKASDNELRVSVRATSVEVEITITDTSQGLLAAELQKAFDVFADVSERMRSGMGLYVCQRIVARLGGQIRASSEPGQGNTFQIRLPVVEPTRAAAPKRSLHVVAASSMRVLVVDDEELVLRALSRTLEGHDVVCVRSGREAIELLESEAPFDLVLCDVMMPDMNGEDVYRAACRVHPGTEQRIVFVTGGAFTSNASAFLDSVPNRRIEKPFSKASIQELLADLRTR